MKEEELEFMANLIEKAHWLFYGDWEDTLSKFLKTVFKYDFKMYGFDEIPMTDDFRVAYWAILSELVSLDLVEYGTSPRGAWLTEDGERFKKIIMAYDDPIEQVEHYIHKKYNS